MLSFHNLFIKFESATDCKFSTIITFPEEEDLLRRKRLAERADQSMLNRDVKGNEQEDENEEPMDNSRFVVASHFKKKMAKEVKDIVSDSIAADQFLKSVALKKRERKKRNIRASILNSTNPDKQEVDFIKYNIDDFMEQQDQKKQKKLQD